MCRLKTADFRAVTLPVAGFDEDRHGGAQIVLEGGRPIHTANFFGHFVTFEKSAICGAFKDNQEMYARQNCQSVTK